MDRRRCIRPLAGGRGERKAPGTRPFEGAFSRSALAVGGLWTVLAQVVVFGNVHGESGTGRSQEHAAEGEAGDVFEDVGVLDSLGGGFAPGEGSVAGDQYAGDGDGVEVVAAEKADDDGAGRADIGLCDLLGGEGFGDGNRAVEVVGVCGAKAGDGAAG